MAQGSSAAFGNYLRVLRERRRFSLLDVSRLTRSSPRFIDKGTLSRFERGQQRISVQSLIPLSRIYAVPAEVLLERLELDTELDGLNGPDTEGKTYAELRRLGKDALFGKSRKWDAYGFFRDALQRAQDGQGVEDGEDRDQLRAIAQTNLATVARSLGRNRLALHELLEVEDAGGIGAAYAPILLDRIANCYRCLDRWEMADRYVDASITQASALRDKRALAYAYYSRASLTILRGDYRQGIDLLREAFRAHRDSTEGRSIVAPNPTFEVDALLKLSDAYLHLKWHERAGRAALAAKSLATRAALPGEQAYSEIALGEVDELTGRAERALQRWTRAAQVAKAIHNKRLGFIAEFCVFRRAVIDGHNSLARASRTRLERLEPWIPTHLPELAAFDELCTRNLLHCRTRPERNGRPRRREDGVTEA